MPDSVLIHFESSQNMLVLLSLNDRRIFIVDSSLHIYWLTGA